MNISIFTWDKDDYLIFKDIKVDWCLLCFFYTVVKKFMITNNSVAKIQNLVLIHESRPVKSNSVRENILAAKLNFLVNFVPKS